MELSIDPSLPTIQMMIAFHGSSKRVPSEIFEFRLKTWNDLWLLIYNNSPYTAASDIGVFTVHNQFVSDNKGNFSIDLKHKQKNLSRWNGKFLIVRQINRHPLMAKL